MGTARLPAPGKHSAVLLSLKELSMVAWGTGAPGALSL